MAVSIGAPYVDAEIDSMRSIVLKEIINIIPEYCRSLPHPDFDSKGGMDASRETEIRRGGRKVYV